MYSLLSLSERNVIIKFCPSDTPCKVSFQIVQPNYYVGDLTFIRDLEVKCTFLKYFYVFLRGGKQFMSRRYYCNYNKTELDIKNR